MGGLREGEVENEAGCPPAYQLSVSNYLTYILLSLTKLAIFLIC